MKIKSKILAVIAAFAFVLSISACASSSVGEDSWEDNPAVVAITRFMSEYFPQQATSGVRQIDDSYLVKVNSGPSVTFDSSGKWMSVVGYGARLPQMFLFDQLPPDLYEYIQGLDAVDGVYSVINDHGLYSVDLLNTSVVYDSSTGTISQPADYVRAVSLTL